MRLPGVKCPKKKEMKRGIPWLSMRKAKIEDLELGFICFRTIFTQGSLLYFLRKLGLHQVNIEKKIKCQGD